MIKTKVKVTFPNANILIRQIGLQRGGLVQKFIDSEIARGCDDYAPSDTTALRKSVYKNSEFGKGELTWDIYGKEGGRNTWNDTTSKFQDAPMRGSFWAIRFWNGGGKEKVIKATNGFIRSLKNGRASTSTS